MGVGRKIGGWAAWGGIAASAVILRGAVIPATAAASFPPELPVLVLTFLGLHGRREVVLPAAVLLGAGVALFSVAPPEGILAVYFALALVLVAVRRLLFREHLLTEGLVVAVAVLAYRFAGGALLSPGGGGGWWVVGGGRPPAGGALEAWAAAALTGGVAMAAFPLLRRSWLLRGLMGVRVR